MIPRKIVFLALAIPILSLAIACYISVTSESNLLETLAFAQLILSMLTFAVILYTLYYASVQFRKSMAKPKLEVMFTESNSSEFSIKILPNRDDRHHLKLSVVNKGNAITDLFQIDFDIPEVFNPRIIEETAFAVRYRTDGDNRIASFINKHQHICFVNNPIAIPSLKLDTHKDEYGAYPAHLVIPYKVYGDWAETQEGELKININKQ